MHGLISVDFQNDFNSEHDYSLNCGPLGPITTLIYNKSRNQESLENFFWVKMSVALTISFKTVRSIREEIIK